MDSNMPDKIERVYYLDALRSTLMLLGVVVHAANIFAPGEPWKIYSKDSIEFAHFISGSIHVFRMPAFFVISGYFCALALRHYRPENFLKRRVQRLAIPLISTALLLNSLEISVLVHDGWQKLTLHEYFLDGVWVSHLWFLINLLVYTCGAVILYAYLREPVHYLGGCLGKLISSMPMVLLFALMPIYTLALLATNKVGFPLYANLAGLIDFYTLLYFLPFFIFGTVLGAKRECLTRFEKTSFWIPILLIISVIAMILIDNARFGTLMHRIADTYLLELITWLSMSLCFYVFCRYCNHRSKVWSYLSDASYSVYLFHHLIVILLGILAIRMGLNSHMSLAAIITLTIGLTLAIHHFVIRRYRTASLLFNGK